MYSFKTFVILLMTWACLLIILNVYTVRLYKHLSKFFFLSPCKFQLSSLFILCPRLVHFCLYLYMNPFLTLFLARFFRNVKTHTEYATLHIYIEERCLFLKAQKIFSFHNAVLEIAPDTFFAIFNES